MLLSCSASPYSRNLLVVPFVHQNGASCAAACIHCSHAVHPGAVVLELLAYNWEWKGISEVYYNTTSSVGDIHHFAWRAKHPRWAQYVDEDEARYAHWTAEECSSRCAVYCLTLTNSMYSMPAVLAHQNARLQPSGAGIVGENIAKLMRIDMIDMHSCISGEAD